jgi:hypothetical protein
MKKKQIRKYMTETKLKKSQKMRQKIRDLQFKIRSLESKRDYEIGMLVRLLIE